MSEWKTLRETELGNKCFHNPEWAHDEIERLTAGKEKALRHLGECEDELRQANARVEALEGLRPHIIEAYSLAKERACQPDMMDQPIPKCFGAITEWLEEQAATECEEL